MTSIYIDYPDPHFAARVGVTAAERFRHGDIQRRVIRITPQTFSEDVRPFLVREVPFGASSGLNDLYLELDFDNVEFEAAIGKYLQAILGERYRPLATAEWR